MDQTPDLGNLRRRAVSGAIFTAGAQAARVGLQLASVVILSRLLSPSDFGLVAMIAPVVAFVMLFGDLGLTQAVVTARAVTPVQLDTVFWVNVAFGVALFAVIGFAAPAVAAFYGEPALIDPLRVLAATVLFTALGTQHKALITRSLQFHRIAAVEVFAAAAGFAAAIAVALVRPDVWALVAGTVTTALTTVVAWWLLSPWRPGLRMRISEGAGLLNFGKGVLGFNLFNFLSRNLDNVLIGRFAGAVQLGFYDRAYKLLLFPLSQINNPVGRVVTPMLARLVDEPARYRRVYLRTVQQILLVTLPGIVFALVNADAVIPLVLGEKWAASVPIFIGLGFAAVIQPLTATTGWLFISQSRTDEYALWGLVSAAISIGAFVAGLPWGAVGVAAAYGASELLLKSPAVWFWIGRRGPVSTFDLADLAWPNALAVGTAGFVLLTLRDVALAGPLPVDLALKAAVAYAVSWSCLAILPQGREAFGQMALTARSLVGRPT